MRDLDQYGTQKVQSELLTMIKDIDYILKKNNVRYSLNGGSVLGAVRHGGFIPWDDDVDIMLEREYLKVAIEALNSSENYCVIRDLWLHRIKRRETTGTSEFQATVDIFVVDHCPDNTLIWNMKVLLLRILQGMLHKKPEYKGYSFNYKVCMFATYNFGRLFSYDRKFEWYTRTAQIGNKKSTKHVEFSEDLFKNLKLRYDRNLMENIVYHKFEDTELPIVKEYDNYLTITYGDYMTPPDKKDRIPQHM